MRSSYLITLLIFVFTGQLLAQEANPAETVLKEKIAKSFFLLSDGQNQGYGIYLAGQRDKKYVYFAAPENIHVGLDVKLQTTFLNGDKEDYEAEKLIVEGNSSGVSVYKVKRSPKDIETITRYHDLSTAAGDTLWTLKSVEGSLMPVKFSGLVDEGRRFSISGELPELQRGLPVFNSHSDLLGMVLGKTEAGDYECLAIGTIIEQAVTTLKGVDLYPTWKEKYPSQYAVEKVMASSALLFTDKPGSGFYVARDTDDTGYILTANHVVASVEDSFNVFFASLPDQPYWGHLVESSRDTLLDMALVKVRNCPEIITITFWRKQSLEKLEKGFAVQNVANIGIMNETRPPYGYFQSKVAEVEKVAGERTLQTSLQVQSGDSGGPLFNENGEVLGINLRRESDTSGERDSVAVAINNRTMINYLETQLRDVELKEQWQFLLYPGFWAKYKYWITTTALVGGGTTAFLLKRAEVEPFSDFSGGPQDP